MATSGSPLGNILVRFTGDSAPLEESLQKMEGAVSEFSSHVVAVTGSLAEAFALAELGKSAFEAAEKFEQATFSIERSTGATGETLKGLEESFKAVYAQTGASAEAVAGAISQLKIDTQLTGEEMEKFALTNIRLSKIVGGDVKTNIEKTQDLFDQWGISTSEQTGKLDALTTLVQKTGAHFSTLTATLQNQKPVLQGLGFSFDQSAALIANFDAHGFNAEKVVAALQKGLVTLAEKGFKDPQAALQGLIQKLQSAETATGAIDLAAQVFGRKGAVFIQDAARSGAFEIGELQKAMADSSGTIAKTAADTQSFGDRWAKVQHQIEEALVPLGTPILKALTDLVEAAKPLTGKLAELVKWFTELPGWVQGATVALLLLPPAIELGITAMSRFLALEVVEFGVRFAGMVSNIAFAIWNGLIPALNATEVWILRFAAIGAVVAAAILIYEKLRDIWVNLKETFTSSSTETEKLAQSTKDLNKQTIECLDDVQLAAARWREFKASLPNLTDALVLPLTLINNLIIQFQALTKDAYASMDKAAAAVVPKLTTWNDNFNRTLAEQAGAYKKIGPEQEAYNRAHVDLSSLFSKSIDKAKELAQAYSHLGIESDKLRNIEAALALVYRTNSSADLPKTITGYEALAALYAKGKITADQFRSSLITVGEAMVKALPPDKLVDFLKNFATIVPLKTVAQDFQTLGIVSQQSLDKTAKEAAEAYHSILVDSNTTTYDIERAWLKMTDTQVAAGKVLTQEELDKYNRIRESVSRTAEGLGGLGQAFRTLGITSDAALSELAIRAAGAYDKISTDARSSTRDIDVAWLRMTEAQIAAGERLSRETIEKYHKIKDEVVRSLDPIADAFSRLGIKSQAALDELAIQATNDYNVILNDATSTAVDIDRAWLKMMDSLIAKGVVLTQQTLDQYNKIKHAVEATTSGLGELGQAYKDLGVVSQASLEATAERARTAYQTIASDANSSTLDQERAWVRMVDAQIAAGEKLTLATQAQYVIITNHIQQSANSWIQTFKQIHEAVINDLSNALKDVIFQTGSLSDNFKKMGEDIVGIILHKIIEQGIDALLHSLTNLGGVAGKVFGGIFGSAGSAVGSAAGGAASSAGGAAGSAATGILGAASGVLAGWVGVGVSAISGIVSGIQQAHANNLLDEIEKSTRFSWIALGGSGGASINDWTHLTYNEIAETHKWLIATHDWWVELLDDLGQIAHDIKTIASGSGGGVAGFSNGAAILNFHEGSIAVHGVSDPRAAASAVAREIPRFLKSRSRAFI